MGLKIAVLSRNFSATGGGAERYAIALVEQLSARHEVHVFAQTVAHPLAGVTYHRIAQPVQRPRWINQLWFAFATWRQTRTGFDIVHSHENSWHGNVQTLHVQPVRDALFAQRQGWMRVLRWVKVCTSPRLLAYMGLERARLAPRARRCVVLASEPLRSMLHRAYPDAQVELQVVAPGVAMPPPRDTGSKVAARRELGLPWDGNCLLFVGNDFAKKGLPALLQALPKLPSSVFLAVVGSGEQNHSMRQLVVRLGLEARVQFLGALRSVNLAYCAADALVHPTLQDSYAMVVLEAMAHGLPVLVSPAAYCGISAELQHAVNAWLLQDPRDASEIAQAIQTVLGNAALAQALGQNARAFASARSWASVAQRYEHIYARVAPRYRQRWLVLAHAFNMDGRAASQTITDKLPHLERAGVEVVVLSGVTGTPDRLYTHYRLWPLGPAGIRFELRHVLRMRLGSGWPYRAVMLPAALFLLPFMLLEKLLRPVESSWSWYLSAYRKGRSVLRRQHFDLIYSTGGALAAHMAGAALQRATGVRWLAEVHDPLVTPGREVAGEWNAQERLQARVEATICARADVAIWFTEQALASALRRHPVLGARGHAVLAGVDRPTDVLAPYQPGAHCVLGHFGSLSSTRNLVAVLQAMESLFARQPHAQADLRLHVYGGPLDAVSAQALRTSRVRACVQHFGRIETDPVTGQSGRAQILQRMRSADVLLLLHGSDPICSEYIPSKLYEYLWMQRPILALVHANPQMQRLLLAQGHRVVQTGAGSGGDAAAHALAEAEALVQALETVYLQWRAGGLPDRAAHSPYTVAAAVQRLLQLGSPALSQSAPEEATHAA